MIPKNILFLILVFPLLVGTGRASSVPDTLDDTTTFINNDSIAFARSEQNLPIRFELNTITNSNGLSKTAAKLRQLHDKKLKTVSIVHIGDSHLQPGLISAPVREWLQKKYGNAGRGLVFPYRTIKTNGPEDYGFTRTGTWTGHPLLRRKPATDTLLPGISGYVALSPDSNASLCISVSDSEDRFNTLQVFAKNSPAIVCCVNKTGGDSFIPEKKITGAFPWIQVLALDSLSSQATVTGCSPHWEKAVFATEGMVLLNNQPGVLYHSIGVNGAQVEDFLSARMFWEELPALRPDLLIVSLGVNDAYEPPFDTAEFRQNLDSLCRLIAMAAPDCEILFTTVTDHDFGKKQLRSRTVTLKNGKKVKRAYAVKTFIQNPRKAPCNQTILRFCGKKGIACWNIFEIMGGDGSIAAWEKEKAARSDRLHFSIAGYKILGTLLQKALETVFTP